MKRTPTLLTIVVAMACCAPALSAAAETFSHKAVKPKSAHGHKAPMRHDQLTLYPHGKPARRQRNMRLPSSVRSADPDPQHLYGRAAVVTERPPVYRPFEFRRRILSDLFISFAAGIFPPGYVYIAPHVCLSRHKGLLDRDWAALKALGCGSSRALDKALDALLDFGSGCLCRLGTGGVGRRPTMSFRRRLVGWALVLGFGACGLSVSGAPRGGVSWMSSAHAQGPIRNLIARLRGQALPEGIVQSNGRLEATQVDVSSKYPGAWRK